MTENWEYRKVITQNIYIQTDHEESLWLKTATFGPTARVLIEEAYSVYLFVAKGL